MIEVNLIPDVKRELLHTRKVRNLVVSASMIAAAASAGTLIVLGIVLGSVQIASNVASNSIKSKYKELSSKTDINNLLTIQNQLTQIDTISNTKGIYSRIFDVANAVNPQAPNNVTMSSIKYSATDKTITIEGSASGGFNAVDALKKTIINTKLKYTMDSESTETNLSSNVTIADTSYGEDASGSKKLNFTLVFTYADVLLSNTAKNLTVETPNGSVDVTDSKTHVPDSLFQSSASSNDKENN